MIMRYDIKVFWKDGKLHEKLEKVYVLIGFLLQLWY